VTWLFTQVWLWSLAAFLLGSLFTWLLFVLPLRRRLNAIIAEYAHRPPAHLSQPDEYYQPQSTALDLFEPQRPAAVSGDDDGRAVQAEFPGPGRWEPFDSVSPGEDAALARSRSALSQRPPAHGMDAPPASELGPHDPAPPQTTEVGRPGNWFDGPESGEQTVQAPDSVATPEEQPGEGGNSREQAGHRVPPYVPPSDPEITQVIPLIDEEPHSNAAPVAPGEQYVIKGHFASRQYHTPDSPQYNHIVAEVWFRTVEDAEQAGFESWNARTH
jgi:hypothetical protein